MGNCQAIDAAALVIQHPCGKIERMYWPVTASEIMRLNPGHYVSLIIPLPRPPTAPGDDHKVVSAATTAVQFTRVKLLRPTDTLALGHAYRLVTTQEVVKVLRAKKSAKMKKQEAEPGEKPEAILSDKQSSDSRKSDSDKDFHFQFQASKQGSHRRRAAPVNPSALRSKSWRPTLHSISEAAS